MDEKLMMKSEELADRNYSVVFSLEQTDNGQSLYMAKNPELIGCMAQGETLEDAIRNLRDARIDYIYDSLRSGSSIPEPATAKPETLVVQTAGTATTATNKTFIAGLKIETYIPADMPDQPIVRQVQQFNQYANA